MTDHVPHVPAILIALDCLRDAALKQVSGIQPMLQRSLPSCGNKRSFVKNVILASLAVQDLAAIRWEMIGERGGWSLS